MSIKFNSTGVEVGFIKEFLINHPIPSYHILESNNRVSGVRYIDGDNIVSYNQNNDKIVLSSFDIRDKNNNMMRHLNIRSNKYDSYTHYFLGDYLRFLRDYYKLDLMPLYNCFGNEVMPNMSSDKYNYYMIPIKLGKTYTVGMESMTSFNIYMAYENESSLSNPLVQLIAKVPGASRRAPFTFSTPSVSSNAEYFKKERLLRAVIALPKVVNTPITVLEGIYTFGADQVLKLPITVRDDEDPSPQEAVLPRVFRLSLLDIFGSETKPFADRLLEYLLDSVVTPMETIQYNVARIQNDAYKGVPFVGTYDIWDDSLRNRLFEIAMTKDVKNDDKKYYQVLMDELYYGDKDIISMLGA